MAWRGYFVRVAAAVSQLVNALLGGHNNMTLSARTHLKSRLHGGVWEQLRRAINALFFWQGDHCRRSWQGDVEWSAEVVELDRLIHPFHVDGR